MHIASNRSLPANLRSLDEAKRNPGFDSLHSPDSIPFHPGYACSFLSYE